MEKKNKLLTRQQQKALHLFYEHLAQELSDAGLDMKKTLKPEIDIPWSARTVKDFLWRPIQQAQLQKKSTTELTTTDIDKVVNTLTRHLGERFGIEIQFPCIEEVMRQMDETDTKKT